MKEQELVTIKSFCPTCIERIKKKQKKIHQWLKQYEATRELPLYSSVDIRDAGFKIAVVDSNLFPAGFNNLCEHGLEDAVQYMKAAILKRVPQGKNILIVAEEHTRNLWYLENIRILQEIIQKGGFNAKIATFLTEQPQICEGEAFLEFKTATDATVKIYCFKTILDSLEKGIENFDFILLNNDLTTGIPPVLKESKIPIYPSLQAGWHSRHKSNHFSIANDLIEEFAQIVEMDPWFFSCLFSVVEGIDINKESDRLILKTEAEILFKHIEQKYRIHQIPEKPYIVLKSDSGTYGMGVKAFETPEDILHLNRRDKNQLYKGKSSQIISRYLLQEGVPTIYHIDQEVSEACIYQIENNVVGGFYRSNIEKGERDNLNSRGMGFKKMCPHLKKYGEFSVHEDINIFDIYRILARVAAIAAHREIIQLEAKKI